MEKKKKTKSNSLIEEFDIDLNVTREDDINDYDFFKDKNLLDKIRKEIIQNVIDNNIPGTEIFSFENFLLLLKFLHHIFHLYFHYNIPIFLIFLEFV